MENIDKTFRPTTQWMAEKYDDMNQQLFGGKLMGCEFEVFTRGAGMEGGTLGWFCMEGGIRVERRGRAMFKEMGWDRSYVNRGNFVALAKPKIKLNGNYSGTEHAFLATLVHEMCHYYTYMDGYAPKQAHGYEFREIGSIVSSRSNGMFTIQRLASAEQMNEMTLNDEMKAKRAKRLANKKSSVSAIIVFTQEGKVKLTITSSQNLINLISKTESSERDNKVITTNNSEVIDFLFSKGYKKNMRSWRYWSLEEKPWLNELKSLLGDVPKEEPKVEEKPEVKTPKRTFSIKTSNGVFEYDGTAYFALVKALKERFPKMSDEAIKKIVNNPANYRIEENRFMKKNIIKEVIDEFMNKEFGGKDDSIEINPEMNLGIESIV